MVQRQIFALPGRGVMCRAAGHDLHGDCLSCATCGSSLRNVGHHFIEDKFYCEVHGRQKKGLGPAMDPNLAA
ncbi:LIM domain protein, partial [Ancylostoma duodenale]